MRTGTRKIRLSSTGNGRKGRVTCFASPADIHRQAHYFADQMVPRQLAEATSDIILVLNQQQQVVYVNAFTLKFLGLKDAQTILGLRYGEVLGCVHAFQTRGGCGATEFCKTCGAAHAILSSQHGVAGTTEWRITRQQDEDMDALVFRVGVIPLTVETEHFTVFACVDISGEKRRRALERIFFHDVLNTAGMLQATVELMYELEDQDVAEELEQKARRLTRRLVREIEAQRELTEAENYELSVDLIEIRSLELLRQTAAMYLNREMAEGRPIRIAEDSEDVLFVSDSTLLGRVIGNMVKNALEASEPGQTVTLGCGVIGDSIEFWVHNAASMPEEIQLQVFQRAFSTKGAGRGLGTYSMRLLSQRYLRGEVSFTSSEQEGTTFRARYPFAS
jgi:signal transduction histidine kinase